MKQYVMVALFMLSGIGVAAQFGYGLVSRLDLYDRYSNPQDNIASAGSGSALINLGLGPKIWVGGESFSVSAEAAFVFSPFALSLGDFKGMGALALPVLIRANIQGLSTMNREGKMGLSIGAGYQWTRTELLGLQNSFEDQGVQRSYFKNLIAEVGYGYGMNGMSFGLFLRYGRDADVKSNVFALGMIVNLNRSLLKITTDPEF